MPSTGRFVAPLAVAASVSLSVKARPQGRRAFTYQLEQLRNLVVGDGDRNRIDPGHVGNVAVCHVWRGDIR